MTCLQSVCDTGEAWKAAGGYAFTKRWCKHKVEVSLCLLGQLSGGMVILKSCVVTQNTLV